MPEPLSTKAPDARSSGAFRMRERIGPHPWVQLGVLLGLAAAAYLLWHSLSANMAQSGIVAGFAFLHQPANFEIGESLIAYSAQSSFGRAILVGLLNTLLVSVAGCVVATVLGLALGIARITGTPLVAGAVRCYVEIIRNTPLLLQLFFWSASVQALPVLRQALEPVPGVILSNRGIYFPGHVAFSSGPGLGRRPSPCRILAGAEREPPLTPLKPGAGWGLHCWPRC